MPEENTRKRLINSRKPTGDAIDMTLGGSGNTARPKFGPNSPGAKSKKSNSDTFVTDERYGGENVEDHSVPDPSYRIP